RLPIESSSVIQKLTEASGPEITTDQIWSAFERTYLTTEEPVALIGHPVITTAPDTGDATIEAHVKLSSGPRWLKGQGNGPIAASVDALLGAGIPIPITAYPEHAPSGCARARPAAHVPARVGRSAQ